MFYTLMHEHITIDLSKEKGNPDCRLDTFDETLSELNTLYQQGVRRIVDVTEPGMGRNPEYLAEMSEKSGIRILHSTGVYKAPFLPEWFVGAEVQDITARMISEIQDGIDGKYKASMIGEIGSSKNNFTEVEKKVFDAAVIASKETGTPIYTHTTLGTMGIEQADFFKQKGQDLARVVIGHMDLTGNMEYICRVLDTGVTVGFDTVGKNNYLPDSKRAALLKALTDSGYASQIVLSMDITRKSHLKAFGGYGYSYLIEKFLPMLQKAGVSDYSIKKMLVDNPARILDNI